MSSHDSRSHRGINDDVEITLVAAVDEQNIIGKEGQLPWHLPADLRHFKEVTMGHPVVMGRKTFESLGEPLAGRTNIVLSRNKDYEAPGCIVVHGIEEAIDAATAEGTHQIMVLGGEGVFRRFLPRAHAMELTRVHGEYEGDVFFPDFDEDDWEVVDEEYREADEDNEVAMTFRRLERVRH